jgi:hypothetical protein
LACGQQRPGAAQTDPVAQPVPLPQDGPWAPWCGWRSHWQTTWKVPTVRLMQAALAPQQLPPAPQAIGKVGGHLGPTAARTQTFPGPQVVFIGQHEAPQRRPFAQ